MCDARRVEDEIEGFKSSGTYVLQLTNGQNFIRVYATGCVLAFVCQYATNFTVRLRLRFLGLRQDSGVSASCLG